MIIGKVLLLRLRLIPSWLRLRPSWHTAPAVMYSECSRQKKYARVQLAVARLTTQKHSKNTGGGGVRCVEGPADNGSKQATPTHSNHQQRRWPEPLALLAPPGPSPHPHAPHPPTYPPPTQGIGKTAAAPPPSPTVSQSCPAAPGACPGSVSHRPGRRGRSTT